tara:strand:- start:2169 stop:2720 length:552 start_codon:yes stop_codon:yes gene_type:complete
LNQQLKVNINKNYNKQKNNKFNLYLHYMFTNGSNRLLYIKWEGVYLPIGCLTSDSFSETSEMLNTTTRDNAGWKTSTPTNQSYNISFDGLIINTQFKEGNPLKLSYDRLRILKRNRTLIDWKISDSGDLFVDLGKGYISSLSDSSSTDEFTSFSVEIEGYGTPYSYSGYLITNSLQQEIQYEL